MELSKLFDVSIDYLLKPSEIDELSVKTQILEQQQKKMLFREEKRTVFTCRLPAVSCGGFCGTRDGIYFGIGTGMGIIGQAYDIC